MAKEKENLTEEEEDSPIVVEFSDEEGNSFLYVQDDIVMVDGKKYALLTEIVEPDAKHEHHHHEHGDGCDCGSEEGETIIAKIVLDENGEEEYVEPTDEEFDLVLKVLDEEEDEEEEDHKS